MSEHCIITIKQVGGLTKRAGAGYLRIVWEECWRGRARLNCTGTAIYIEMLLRDVEIQNCLLQQHLDFSRSFMSLVNLSHRSFSHGQGSLAARGKTVKLGRSFSASVIRPGPKTKVIGGGDVNTVRAQFGRITNKLSIGVVGLPNVGKSSIFNALTQSDRAFVANYPFVS